MRYSVAHTGEPAPVHRRQIKFRYWPTSVHAVPSEQMNGMGSKHRDTYKSQPSMPDIRVYSPTGFV